MKRMRPLLVWCLLTAAATPLVGQQQLRPADPLTPAEITQAGEAATASASERSPRERLELVSVELTNVKPAEPGRGEVSPADAGRHALVTFYDYERNEGVVVLVDLRAARVVRSTSIHRRAVPLGPNEIQRAAGIALASADVRRIVRADTPEVSYRTEGRPGPGDDVVEGLRVISADPDDHCSVDRCVDLFFRLNGRYLVGQRITVNLTRRTVTVTAQEERGATR